MNSPDDDDDWMHAPGARRHGYEILARVARGGYGEVYDVRDGEGARWAMKLVQTKGQRDRNAVRRGVQEARLLQGIDHINVVRYHDAFLDTDGTVGIVTEFLPGKPLRHVMNGGALTVERSLRLARQICYAAAVVHAKGAVHRDIKPENVFLMPADVIKLLDFGIAHCAGVELHTTRPIGTPLYMSPDHLSFDTKSGLKPDPRWDVYSIGLILYELIRGRHPFEGDAGEMPTAAVVIGRQLHMPVPLLSDIVPGFPNEVARVIARAVEKDAALRYQSAEAFAEAITEARRAVVARFEAAPQPLLADELSKIDPRTTGGAAVAPTVRASAPIDEGTTEPRASSPGVRGAMVSPVTPIPREAPLEDRTTERRISTPGATPVVARPGSLGTVPMLPVLNLRQPQNGTELMVPRLQVVDGKLQRADGSAGSARRIESPAQVRQVSHDSPSPSPAFVAQRIPPSSPSNPGGYELSRDSAAPGCSTIAMPPRRGLLGLGCSRRSRARSCSPSCSRCASCGRKFSARRRPRATRRSWPTGASRDISRPADDFLSARGSGSGLLF